MDRILIANEILEISKMLTSALSKTSAEVSSKETARALLGKKVANGVPREAAVPYAGLSTLQIKAAQQAGEKMADSFISQAIRKAFDYETNKRLNPDQASIMDGMLYMILDYGSSALIKRKRQI